MDHVHGSWKVFNKASCLLKFTHGQSKSLSYPRPTRSRHQSSSGEQAFIGVNLPGNPGGLGRRFRDTDEWFLVGSLSLVYIWPTKEQDSVGPTVGSSTV